MIITPIGDDWTPLTHARCLFFFNFCCCCWSLFYVWFFPFHRMRPKMKSYVSTVRLHRLVKPTRYLSLVLLFAMIFFSLSRGRGRRAKRKIFCIYLFTLQLFDDDVCLRIVLARVCFLEIPRYGFVCVCVCVWQTRILKTCLSLNTNVCNLLCPTDLPLSLFCLGLFQDQATKEKALQNMSSMSSAQIVSASSLHNNKTSLSGLGLPAPVSYPPPVWFIIHYNHHHHHIPLFIFV